MGEQNSLRISWLDWGEKYHLLAPIVFVPSDDEV
jgi:hypothetical protein